MYYTNPSGYDVYIYIYIHIYIYIYIYIIQIRPLRREIACRRLWRDPRGVLLKGGSVSMVVPFTLANVLLEVPNTSQSPRKHPDPHDKTTC